MVFHLHVCGFVVSCMCSRMWCVVYVCVDSVYCGILWARFLGIESVNTVLHLHVCGFGVLCMCVWM